MLATEAHTTTPSISDFGWKWSKRAMTGAVLDFRGIDGIVSNYVRYTCECSGEVVFRAQRFPRWVLGRPVA